MARSFLPLRLKLTLWSVLVFLVTLLTLYLGIWIFAKSRSSLDVQGDLRSKSAAAVERLKDPETLLRSQVELDAIARRMSSSPLSRRFSIRLWTEDGTLYSSSGDDDSLRDVPFARTEDPAEVRIEKRRTSVADGGEVVLHVATREFTAADGKRLYAEIATPAVATDEDFVALRNFALYILPVGSN